MSCPFLYALRLTANFSGDCVSFCCEFLACLRWFADVLSPQIPWYDRHVPGPPQLPERTVRPLLRSPVGNPYDDVVSE